MKTKAKQLLSDLSGDLKELKVDHREVDDPYYSCQKTEDYKIYTGNDDDNVCTCGADYYNNKIDLIIKKIERFIMENRIGHRD